MSERLTVADPPRVFPVVFQASDGRQAWVERIETPEGPALVVGPEGVTPDEWAEVAQAALVAVAKIGAPISYGGEV